MWRYITMGIKVECDWCNTEISKEDDLTWIHTKHKHYKTGILVNGKHLPVTVDYYYHWDCYYNSYESFAAFGKDHLGEYLYDFTTV